MRRFLLFLAGLLLVSRVAATTFYVDGGCMHNGNGNGPDCADGPNALGAFNTIYTPGTNNIVKTLASGDILDIRGRHAADLTGHPGSPANHRDVIFDGNYYERWLGISYPSCSPNRCTIQAHNWVGWGTGEVYTLSGTRCPSGGSATFCGEGAGWTRCSTCGSGICNGVPGTCTDTWYTTDNGTAGAGFQSGSASEVRSAQTGTGSPTYMVDGNLECTGSGAPVACCSGLRTGTCSGKEFLATSFARYVSGRCANSTWKACSNDTECYPTLRHGPCSASQPLVVGWRCVSGSDANSCPSGDRLFVHWGSSLPTRPYIPYNTINTSFDIQSGSHMVDIKGGVVLNHAENAVYFSNSTNDHVVDDLTVFYTYRGLTGGGSCRSILVAGSTPVIIRNSELAYSSDEGIHAQGRSGIPNVYTFQNSWIHDQGNPEIFGIQTNGAPSPILIGDDNAVEATSDYNGSVIDGNLLTGNTAMSGGAGSGGATIRWETGRNLIVRNNVMADQGASGAACFSLGHAALNSAADSTNNNEIYNNLAIGCGTATFEFYADNASGTQDTSGNKVYFNTIVNSGTSQCGGAICTSPNPVTGTMANNKIRDNVLYSGSGGKLVNWLNATASNKYEYNMSWTSAPVVATWLGVNYNCCQNSSCTGSGTPCACCTGSGTGTCVGIQALHISNLPGCPGINDPIGFRNAAGNDFHLSSDSVLRAGNAETAEMPAGRTRDIFNQLAGFHGLPAYADGEDMQDGLCCAGPTWDFGCDEYPFWNAGAGITGCTSAMIDSGRGLICPK